MSSVIDALGGEHGVEPTCRVLEVAPSTYYAVKARERDPCARALRDKQLLREIRRVHKQNYSVYGARKVYWQLRREGIPAARCTVERLMRAHGIRGAMRGKRRRTTIPDKRAAKAPDLVKRNFKTSAPNRLWCADFTHVASWAGVCYVAFLIDVFSRRIVGWKADTTMKTPLVLDTLEMALWARDHHGLPVADGLVHHSDAGSQFTSFAFTQRLVDAGVDASIGSVGDAYDNALCESTIGLYKTELIDRRGPWKTIDQVELATLEWVDWYNNRRLHEACGNMPPVEYERGFLEGTIMPVEGPSQDDGSPAAPLPRGSDRLTIARSPATDVDSPSAAKPGGTTSATVARAGDAQAATGAAGEPRTCRVASTTVRSPRTPTDRGISERTQTNRSP
jgi:putative transposase